MIEQRKKLNNDTVADKTSANYKGALNFFQSPEMRQGGQTLEPLNLHIIRCWLPCVMG